MAASNLSFKIPQIPEPRHPDPSLDNLLRTMKDAINQLTTSLNTVASRITW